ncbi:PAS domain-containing protein [Streptomyces sp. M19]
MLVRTQSSAVPGADGRPAGVYCAFSEVHSQIDLERSLALSDALLEEASWGVVLVDADLRPAAVNGNAARLLRTGRTTALGRPVGELLDQGVEELENALQHVLADGPPPDPVDLWVSLREAGDGGDGAPGSATTACRGRGRPVRAPLLAQRLPPAVVAAGRGGGAAGRGVAVPGRDGGQAERTGRVAAAVPRQPALPGGAGGGRVRGPFEAATLHLDFALAGFADHALLDLVADARRTGAAGTGTPGLRDRFEEGPAPAGAAGPGGGGPGGTSADPCRSAVSGRASRCRTWTATRRRRQPSGRRGAGERVAHGRAGGGGVGGVAQMASGHGARAVRGAAQPGRTLGVVTFLRGGGRQPFDNADVVYAEDVAVRVAAALDLARQCG